MNSAELNKKIKLLSRVKPEEKWVESNLEILASQLNSGINISAVDYDKSAVYGGNARYYSAVFSSAISRLFSKPALSVVVITAAFLFLASVSLRASHETVPGDSLYIAKRVSEKTQMALTFGEKEKAKLEISFAGERAKEIVKLMEDQDNQEEEKQEQVEKLAKEFKEGISSSKERLTRIVAKNQSISEFENKTEESSPAETENSSSVEAQEQNSEPEVFSANMEKEDKGLEISEGATANPPAETAASSTSTQVETGESVKMLEEAEKLFDSSDYNGSIDKLEEAGDILEQAREEGEDADFQSATSDATTTQ